MNLFVIITKNEENNLQNKNQYTLPLQRRLMDWESI